MTTSQLFYSIENVFYFPYYEALMTLALMPLLPLPSLLTHLHLPKPLESKQLPGMSDVWPMGCIRPTKSFGLTLPRQQQAELKTYYVYSRLIFKLKISYDVPLML